MPEEQSERTPHASQAQADLPRLIAFYLPQYHPIPENDEWWGKGFTEWTNVVKAKPLFPGHYQPHVPADLGFYDLRLAEARQAQADLAKEYGIYGFCYYHYWFHGKRLLERPFNEVLVSGQPDFPFCLCWANESWSRTWDDRGQVSLIEQRYSQEDDRQHIRWLARAFSDKRYITVDGKPLLLVYRASTLPDPQSTTSIWRREAQRYGIKDLYLCRVECGPREREDPASLGFDAAVEFQPDWSNLPLHRRALKYMAVRLHFDYPDVYDYRSVARRMVRKRMPQYPRFSCVMPSWDNTARRKVFATVFRKSSPAIYEEWLTDVIERSSRLNPKENLVFINAWNEWAEGNHLEPCLRWGRAYLEATRRALLRSTVMA
jgi:lipopolysaccharide biosynthesis protein